MQKLIGGILMALGILIALASGLCTLYFGFSGDVGVLGMALLIGGIPFLLGVGLFVLGRTLVQRADAPPA